ncbi:MAG: hypothetical protein Q9165_000319 [Trypethelium subeluteriae]
MGAGASTVVSPAPHPPQQSTSVVPYAQRTHDSNRDPDRSREPNHQSMTSPIIYQPVSAPSGGILNAYDIAPWHAAYARGMLPRRVFGPWSGASLGLGGVDWESVPPLARMMVDVRVRDDEDDGRERGRRRSKKERGRDGDRGGDRGRDRDRDRDRARGDGRHSSRSRHWSRGRSRGGWYSGDEGRSRGRWWSRSRGRDGYDRIERRRKGRRGRGENWRKARGEDAYEEVDDGEYDEEFDEDDDLYDADMRHGRVVGGKRHMLARGGKGKKKGKQLPPWATDPFLHVTDPGARNMFRKMSERIDGVDGRLVGLEEYLRAQEQGAMRPSRENPRFPMGYGGRDFAGEDEFDFGGRGAGRAGGGLGGRRPGMPPRGPPLGRGRGPLNEFDDGGMDMGFGDMDDEATQMNTASDRAYPSDRARTEARNAHQDDPGGNNTANPIPPPPPPPGGFRGGPPGDHGAQRPQTPRGFDGRRPPPGTGPEGMRQDPRVRDDPGEGPSLNPDMRNLRQTWRDDLRGEDAGPPLD